MSEIRIHNLTKQYGRQLVLNRLSFSVPSGGVLVIMGPSGCGKTTLLRILMGFEKADSGEITGMSERLSAVFQEDLLCNQLNAVRNIRIAVGSKDGDQEIRDHLKEVGLGDDLEKPVGSFSSGMRRRVSIVRAVLVPAGMILMDEPLRGLDEELHDRTLEYIRRHTAGKTLLLVTHDEKEAEYFTEEGKGCLLRLEKTEREVPV